MTTDAQPTEDDDDARSPNGKPDGDESTKPADTRNAPGPSGGIAPMENHPTGPGPSGGVSPR